MRPSFKTNPIQLNKPDAPVTGLTINLPSEVVIKTIPAYESKTNKITILSVMDNPSTKTVTAKTLEFGSVILWQGAAYDAIGQWTDTDVQNRLIALYVK